MGYHFQEKSENLILNKTTVTYIKRAVMQPKKFNGAMKFNHTPFLKIVVEQVNCTCLARPRANQS